MSAPRRSDQDRRKHPRKKCFLPAKLLTTAGSFDCVVLDISQGGHETLDGRPLRTRGGMTVCTPRECLHRLRKALLRKAPDEGGVSCLIRQEKRGDSPP